MRQETAIPSMFTELLHSGGKLIVKVGVSGSEMDILIDKELPQGTLVIVERAAREPSPYEDDEEGEDQ